MPKATPLTLPDLGEIDRLSYSKAETILDEARGRLKAFDYDLTVRRSQEAFELYLKSLFRFLQAEYQQVTTLKNRFTSSRKFSSSTRSTAA
jgi:HEPN domain-containing protein